MKKLSCVLMILLLLAFSAQAEKSTDKYFIKNSDVMMPLPSNCLIAAPRMDSADAAALLDMSESDLQKQMKDHGILFFAFPSLTEESASPRYTPSARIDVATARMEDSTASLTDNQLITAGQQIADKLSSENLVFEGLSTFNGIRFLMYSTPDSDNEISNMVGFKDRMMITMECSYSNEEEKARVLPLFRSLASSVMTISKSSSNDKVMTIFKEALLMFASMAVILVGTTLYKRHKKNKSQDA